MKYFFTILFICSFVLVQAQLTYKRQDGTKISLKDTIAILKKQADAHSLVGTNYCMSLFVANGIIVSNQEIDRDLANEYSVLQIPESFKKYGFLGVNGTIQITTKQKFNKIPLKQIQKDKYPHLEGNIIYAINGFFVKDADLLISPDSLIEIEILKINDNSLLSSEYFYSTCICIWTISKPERENPDLLCPKRKELPNVPIKGTVKGAQVKPKT